MIDNLEKKHQITGMSNQEITELLGNPQRISELNGRYRYEYMIRQGVIDPIIYEIYFDNDIASRTMVAEH